MWPFKKRKVYVTLAKERIEVKPLSLPAAVELILLIAPYWPVLEANIPRIEAAIADKDKELITELFFVLREKMQDTPGDITKLIALLVGVDPRWLAASCTAAEIIAVLPALNRAHDFEKLWKIAREGSVYLVRPE